MTNNNWTFRPTAFLSDYAKQTVDSLVTFYNRDNAQATREGVTIPPKPFPSLLRTLQWNVHAFVNTEYKVSRDITDGIIEAILQVDPDVIVLNEYHWDGRDNRHVRFEKQLQDLGYQCQTGTVFCPTFFATRCSARKDDEAISETRLSVERSALMAQVCNEHDTKRRKVWVVGTHLDYANGDQRNKEMQTLLHQLVEQRNIHEKSPIIIVGDLNQQRQQDYDPDAEWTKIAQSMDRRGTCRDDGVAGILQDANFQCAWDQPGVQTNWETDTPPSTHWSGTIVDYSYGRRVKPHGVYISPIGLSDHRMTVCDWRIL